jgi:uncharacterized protein with NRDE domain
MCLIVFALDCHPRYRLILGANRDEYLDRATAPARFWSDAPHLLAGRDLRGGGTWLGVTTGGKLAAVTNYRDMRRQVVTPPSRGGLVASFLRDEALSAAAFRATLQQSGDRYDGFNLIYGTVDELHYFTNRGGSSGPIPPGIHALSNHLLDNPWPKVTAAKERLERLLGLKTIDPADIAAALADPTPFARELLPETGVGPEWELLLSPLFIDSPTYATRSTTVLLVSREGRVTLVEQSHGLSPPPPLRFDFRLPGPDKG